jgi:hypothetical protein
MSLRRSILTSLTFNLLVVATLAAVLMYGLAGEEQRAIRPAVADSAAALVEAHGCGDDVTDPTHAVVTVNQRTRYVGQRLTDRAIEQAVFGVDHGLIVHGFCA